MIVEISVAVSFITSYLYNKLPRRRVDMFAEELQKNLARKLAETWTVEQAEKGRSQRCLRVGGRNGFDPLLLVTAGDCGLDVQEILQYLPNDLTIWIDPKEVSYRFGENDSVRILYSDKLDRDRDRDRDMAKREDVAFVSDGVFGAMSGAGASGMSFVPPSSQPQPQPHPHPQALAANGLHMGNFADAFNHNRAAVNAKDAVSASALIGSSQNGELESLQSRLAALAFAPAAVSPHAVSPNKCTPVLPTGSFAPTVTAAAVSPTVGAATAATPTSSSSAMAKSTSTPSFTAASFAQTKFGSVKPRMQNRRPPIITAADLARHQRAYSSSSASATTPRQNPVTLHSSLPADTAAAAWSHAQLQKPGHGNLKHMNSLQQQMAMNGMKLNTMSGNQQHGGAMPLGLNSAGHRDASPPRNSATNSFDTSGTSAAGQYEMARKLALANATGLFGNGGTPEQVDPAQLMAMCSLYQSYQSRAMLNQFQPDGGEQMHSAFQSSPTNVPGFQTSQTFADRFDCGLSQMPTAAATQAQAQAQAQAHARAQLAAQLSLSSIGTEASARTTSDAISGAAVSAASSLQLSPGQQSDSSKSNKDDYGAEAAGAAAARAAQHLLLAS